HRCAERAPVLPGGRDRRLHVPRRALRLAAQPPDRAHPDLDLQADRARGGLPRRSRGRGEGLMESASVAVGQQAEHEHHGPPPANQSSRVEAQFLGMLLFIISEVMLFGSFFTAYFFIRVVNHDPWPAHGTELPKLVAGVNTAILVSSSFTMHWALEGARKGNRAALKAGLFTTFLLGLTFLTVQINEYVHI